MPHPVIRHNIELHYASPNEMVEQLQAPLQGDPLFLKTTVAIEPGAEREVLLHVPWLGRQVRLRCRVLRAASEREPPGLHLRLLDGPHDTLDQVREIVGRFRTGAILEEPPTEAPPEQRIRAMTPTLRAMLAAKANAEERLILARDPDPRVLEYLLKNPSLSLEEVRRLASRLTLNHGHFATISRNQAWMSDELLRTTLARNPRLPEFMADTVLQTLSIPILKGLVESMNTTAGTRRVATKILLSRGVVVSARKTVG